MHRRISTSETYSIIRITDYEKLYFSIAILEEYPLPGVLDKRAFLSIGVFWEVQNAKCINCVMK